tara:strand:+ start:320 stop:754 length:435 start_codon:yes stop_codon:yes gene_type:complete
MAFKKSKLIKTILRDKDKRGSIISVVNEKCSNVSIISCFKNSIRSNHYHLDDWHYIYVLKGRINYFFTNLKRTKVYYKIIDTNDIIFTPPMEIHATHFPVNTELLVVSKNKRNKTIYEKDTVRVNFINKENISYYINENTKKNK